MRIGLVGTGYWAQVCHAVALQSTPGVSLAGVWGRNPDGAASLAGRLGVPAYAEYDELLEHADALDFAVPPGAQAQLAIRAAEAGKHLLLEKPIAFTTAAADALVSAVERAGVASLVFFTGRFRPETEEWVQAASQADWTSANGLWITAALADASTPWSRSAWRWERGGLWDLGPHALSFLLPTMGPVTGVTAVAGRGDLRHLVLEHEQGRTSSSSFTLRAPQAAQRETLALWGVDGLSVMPEPRTKAVEALGNALTTLAELASAGTRAHPCDVTFGREVVRILELADQPS